MSSRALFWPGVLVAAGLLSMPGAARLGGQTGQAPADQAQQQPPPPRHNASRAGDPAPLPGWRGAACTTRAAARRSVRG